MPFDVVGLGHSTVDYIGVLDHFPESDKKTEIIELSIQGGGPVSTALVTLAGFGVETSYIGKISDDDFGNFIRQGLREAGVDTRGLVIESGKVSPFSFITVDRKTAKRGIFWTRGDVSLLMPQEVQLHLIDGAKILHVDGLAIDAQIAAARYAREHGVTVVYDAGSPRPRMEELMKLTDVLVASERFAAEVGHGALAESLKLLQMKGPRTVVVTIGEEGSVGMENGETYIVPALQIKAVDTTGAGDCFVGAVAAQLAAGKSIHEALAYANVAASISVQRMGAAPSMPTAAEVETILRPTSPPPSDRN
jgi:Sugar kinases, ribokinase family